MKLPLVPAAWLADAPLFIDVSLVASLYNALLLPEYESEFKTVDSRGIKLNASESAFEAGATGGINLVSLFSSRVYGKSTTSDRNEEIDEQGNAVTLRAVHSPESQLMNLVVYFAATFPDSVFVPKVTDPSWWRKFQGKGLGNTVKPLVFIETAPNTPIVPMAAELPDGHTSLFFEEMTRGPGGAPRYPRPTKLPEVKKYWKWHYDGDHSDYRAMEVIEEAASRQGSIRWIDFRIPIGPRVNVVDSLHVHLTSKSEPLSTGDFAYRIVYRGRKHGVRIVGSLQAGPAVNVLAIYER